MENALELAKAFRQKKHFSKEAWIIQDKKYLRRVVDYGY